jgi:hypothetical protein
MTDPIEAIVANALRGAGLDFTTGDGGGNAADLDFYLTGYDVHIEVKQFHSPRIAKQMARAPNVIAIQGRAAAEWFASRLLTRG